ncbi:MAG: fumarate hydratase, partial [Clostridiales bacterium]|nr:fumarate hydratase [Clostridiales bacterium]
MREICCNEITRAVRELFLGCAYRIGDDVKRAVERAKAAEERDNPMGAGILEELLENYRVAETERIALCQDTGMAVIFAEVGQDVHITGGAFEDAVNEGVRQAYTQGYLRAGVVRDPLYDRVNTRDNTPAVIHTRVVPGEHIRLLGAAKGFGSENMSRIAMLRPADGEEGVLDFIVETVRQAGPNPCPPVILGVGIGGDFESCARAAKEMTALPLDGLNPDPRYAALEEKALKEINKLGIGP